MKLFGLAALAAFAFFSDVTSADITHTVARGHTIDAIAHRYHVAPAAIISANHLKDPRHLRVGQSLIIPGVNPPAAHGTLAALTPGHVSPVNYAARPKTPGVMHLRRLATAEETQIHALDRRGHLQPPTLHAMEHVMRYPNGASHPIDARLVSLLGVVSNHFGSRTIEIVSGFRPYSPTQYTAHSNHNIGHAVDFRVVGVPNEVVRDFCRSLRNTGCGYYPNSVFVHMDTRATSAYWVDYSKPGEAPRYSGPHVDADESASDVSDENHTAAPTDQSAPVLAPASTSAPPGSDMTPGADPQISQP